MTYNIFDKFNVKFLMSQYNKKPWEVSFKVKATGIVRRIDDLGRVVIPKEIRRTMRIREGDPLEIYTDADGEVIFKKYSPIEELSPCAMQYAEALSRGTGMVALICDRDHVIASAGVPKREVVDRRVSPMLEDLMENRENFMAEQGKDSLYPVEGYTRAASVAYPVIASGDVSGAVVLLMPEDGKYPTETEKKLVQVAASFLGKQMEE